VQVERWNRAALALLNQHRASPPAPLPMAAPLISTTLRRPAREWIRRAPFFMDRGIEAPALHRVK